MNSVIFWNSILLEASRRDFTKGFPNGQNPGPIATSRAMAIVHVAIHDAVAQKVKPAAAYLPKGAPGTVLPAVTGTNLDDIVAGAAATAIKATYPKSIDFVDASVGTVDSKSYLDGAAVAAAVLAARVGDGLPKDFVTPNASGPTYGYHRGDPYQAGQPQLGETWGQVKRFTGAAHQPLGPYPGHAQRAAKAYLTDMNYAKDFKEVRDLGKLNSSTRTAEQQRNGTFWAYDGVSELGVPPRLYNQILQAWAVKAGLSLAKCADMFAIANVAMADAGIDAWYYKYVYRLWRPVVGIRNEVVPAERDAFWQPLGAPQTNDTKVGLTPPFPAYPSGHATFGAAMFQVLRLFLNTAPGKIKVLDVLNAEQPADPAVPAEEFNFVSDELNGISHDADGSPRTRVDQHLKSFAHAISENALSRVYLGVHWRFDGVPRNAADSIGGVPLGLEVGDEAFSYFKSNNLLVS